MKINMDISGKCADKAVETFGVNIWVLASLTAFAILLLAVSGYGLASSLGLV